MEHHACQRAHGGDGFTLPGAEASYAPDLALEPRHIAVDLRLDVDAETAVGAVTTTVRANREGAQELRLDAVSFEDVAVEGPETWRYDGEGLQLCWTKSFAKGEERAVTVRYTVRSPVSGMQFSRPDEAYPDRPLFVATDHETERARYWLPCVDYPTVRTTFAFAVRAPAGFTILANGVPQGEEVHGDGTKTARWSLDKPCPSYLCCIAAGEFTRCDDGEVDGIPVAYFAPAKYDVATLKRTFGRTGAMMRWLVKRLGRPFPYPKYFQVALPGTGGAMENISLVMWDALYLQDEALHAEWGENVDATNIHEMAHSYFGDDVVCRHFEHSWLKESWAVYVETAYWYENEGREAGDWDLHVNARRYMEEADQRYVRPLVTRTYNSSWDLFDAHLYPGGAWRLHMLRQIAGDEAFWAATTDYLATYSGRVVETDDFRRKVEAHSGLNLNRFFDQWVFGRGYPKLKASFKHDAKKDECTLTIEQTQENKEKEIGLFSFDLEIDVEDDGGWTTHTVGVEDKRHAAVFRCKGKPKQVRLDPRSKVLFAVEFNPGEDMLKRTLTDAEDLRGRIWAAEELIGTGTRANLRAVEEAMAKEPFWGARAAVAEALGKSGSAEAIAPLAAMLDRESSPRAKRFIAKACGAMRDPRLRDTLRRFLEKEQPPWATAWALQALGAQRDPADLPRLEEASRRDGMHRFVAGGALRGMGALRSREALERLERRLAYGAEPEETRPAAIEGLVAGAKGFERETRVRALERLADLTRDRDPRVRLRAGQQIGALGLAEGAGAIEAMKPGVSRQDATRLDRLVAKLKKGGPGEETVQLRERVEKLEEKLRKLDARLQDFEARDGAED